MRPGRLLFAAGVLWVFFVLCANVALKGHVTPGGIVSALLGIVIVGLLLLASGLAKSGGNKTRSEERWEQRGEGPWHREDGDPR